MKTFGVTDYTIYALQKCWGRTDEVDPLLDMLSLKRHS